MNPNSVLPQIETARLLLRPFALADSPEVMRMAGSPEVTRTTLNLPHPYPAGAAEPWIGSHEAAFERREFLTLAITLRESGALCGAIGLSLHEHDQRGELGYWIGAQFWNRGYCTEAAHALLDYGFRKLNLHRIHAAHFEINPASGRVLEKIGMRREGIQRGHHRRFDAFHDRVNYGILASEWSAENSALAFGAEAL